MKKSLNPNQLTTEHHNLIDAMLADLEGKSYSISSETLFSEHFIARGIKLEFNEAFVAKGIKEK